ncbi:MAG TPA: hypothetical protein VLV86_10830 [Vicinamibacterales bacterium]|nr:hypothetical protein [Vicinamibacterales bacterium]
MSTHALVVGEDGWSEIDGIGEMVRGGGGVATDTLAIAGPPGNYDVLGAALAQSPAFQQMLAKRAAAGRPVMHKQPLRMARDWDVPLGPVSGAAGTTTTISFQPQAYFRVEKMMATDTATTAGTGTAITQILVGQRLQRPATSGGTLSLFYSNNSLGNGLRWDTCQPAFSISLTISFVSQCTFYGNLFGKAVV